MRQSLSIKILVIIAQIVCIRSRFFFEQNIDDFTNVIDQKKLTQPKSRSRVRRYWPVQGLPKWHKENIDKNPSIGDIQGTEFILGNDSNNIAFVFWKHHETSVIFILTCQNANTTSFGKLSNKGCHSYGNFYKSEDLGASFKRIDLAAPLKGYWLHCIYLSPIQRGFIVMTDYKNNTIFLTSNEGKNYTQIKVGFSPTSIQFHPTNKNIIAAFDNSKNGKQSLWLSQNKGVTWRFVSQNVKNYFWQSKDLADSSNGLYFERLEREKVIDGKMVSSLCHFPFPKENRVQPIYNKITDLVQDSVYVGNEFVLVQKIKDNDLYVLRPKYDRGFNKVRYLYKNSKTHRHHTIISSDNHEILLGVLHPDNTVTLYLSDETGTSFSYLQENIISEPMDHAGNIPKMDFYRVKGFTNTYIVNKKNNGTLITFDKGYSWSELSYEKIGFDGKRVDDECKKLSLKQCRLNLFLKVEEYYSDYTAPLMSKDSAPGVILAQGRIGTQLSNNIVSTNHDVYISIDGGRKWRKTLGSYYSYAILDHGNAISATPLQFTVKQEIKLSLNYGYHWYKFFLTHHYSRIAAIITDSTAKTLVINVFGFLHQQPKGSSVAGNQWIVWKFNFSSVLPRVCTDKDYYRFFPHDSKCILGEKYSYLQNLRHENKSAKCFSPSDFDLNPMHNPCPCTKADFECDENYVRVKVGEDDFKCKPINDNQKQVKHCDQSGQYIKTKGFRKRHGNKCSGGVEKQLSGTKEQCDVALPVAKIKASHIRVGIGKPVKFSIYHSLNIYGTKYVWEFGDGHTETGTFAEVQTVQHTFDAIGHYTISLIARNSKGSYTDSFPIIVLDESFHNSFIDFEAPLIANQTNSFALKKLTKDGIEIVERKPNLRFLWSFDGVYVGRSDSVQVPFKFTKTGVFEIEAQVISPIDGQTIVRIVRVYKDAYAIDFRFSSYLDRMNTQTATWNRDFIYKFRRFIELRYQIDNTDERLIVQSNKTNTPTTARLIICDVEDTRGRTYVLAKELARKIIDDVNSKKPLFYGYHTVDVHVLSAKRFGPVRHDVTNGGNSNNKTEESYTKSTAWIYVVVVLFVAIIVIGVAILIKYGGKKSWFKIGKDKNDIMQKKLVFHTDEDCVGLEGPDLPPFTD